MWTLETIPDLPFNVKCKYKGCKDIFQVYVQLENHWNAKQVKAYYRIKRWAGADLWSFHDDGFDV